MTEPPRPPETPGTPPAPPAEPAPSHRSPPPPTPALTLLALGSGATDALSFAALGGAFTSVMTGNLVLTGLAAGKARPAGDLIPSVIAIAAFVTGVFLVSRLLRTARSSPRDPWPPRITAALAITAFAQAVVLTGWLVTAGQPSTAAQAGLIAVAGLAMGSQSAAVNALCLPAAATTYLTGTLAMLTSELATAGARETVRRRLTLLLAVVVGASGEAVLLTHAHRLAPVLQLTAAVAVVMLGVVRDLRHRRSARTG
ncbi:YoaK family protein [Actinopolymorpha sp. NPDC004070]|uniref:YoaK family protein n=1 Tax=Actinopolymorpha sp. NPDC004070 TaxID=3154548 RepID=UPI0033B87312